MKQARRDDATAIPDHVARRQLIFIATGLFVVTLLVYARTLTADFINLDDNAYVYENADTVAGLTTAGLWHAFSRIVLANWHPLTMLSHLAVAQLFGLKPWAHHLGNLLLHAGAVVLLFVGLRQLTGAIWRSAFVSLIFAIHPLRVESVAWIAERKDVLMGVFFALSLIAYSRYGRSPSKGRYLLVMVCFAGGLLSKPQMMVVPFLFLLLDYWPLKRITRGGDIWALLVEKLPFLALAGASAVITWMAQRQLTAVSSTLIPLGWRVQNALITLVVYLWQTIWPVRLAPYYPYTGESIPGWQVAGSLVVVVGISGLVLYFRREKPYVLVGWFWYLIALAPVLGLVPVGGHIRADRYTYLPHVGLALAVVWASWEAARRFRYGAAIAVSLGIAGTVAMAVASSIQTGYWRDSETLWTRTLAVTESNGTAENNLGCALLKNAKPEEAVPHLRRAVQLHAADPLAADNLGEALLESGNISEALEFYKKCVAVEPNKAELHDGLGAALLQSGQTAEAINEFHKAIRLNPELASAHCQLGNAFIATGEFDHARIEYEKMLQLQPDNPLALYDIGVALHRAGRLNEAMAYYRRALMVDPKRADAKEFLRQAQEELRLRGDQRP